MEIITAFFDIIFSCKDLIYYVLISVVPMALILFSLGVIWGLTKNVLYHF